MGYLHIENLYKNQNVLLFRELYALEKLHGTSANVRWTPCINAEERSKFFESDVKIKGQQELYASDADHGYLIAFSGGASINLFEAMLNPTELMKKFSAFTDVVEVYGELYGGAQQKQGWRYGKELKFCAFDVKIGSCWLSVPQAEEVAQKLGLEFVSWTKIPGTVEACDAARDAASVQAKRNGVAGDQPMEGVVLRPLIELRDNRDNRIIAKHKRAEERETATERKVEDPSKLQVLADAAAIANEWVTETRLDHVLDKLPQGIGVEKTGDVIKAMVEDVFREAGLEIIDTREARNAISARARVLFHGRVKSVQNPS